MLVAPESKATIQTDTQRHESETSRRRDVWRSLKCWVRSQRHDIVDMDPPKTASEASTAPHDDLGDSWESAHDAGTYKYWLQPVDLGTSTGSGSCPSTSAANPQCADGPLVRNVDSWLAKGDTPIPSATRIPTSSATSKSSPDLPGDDVVFFEDSLACSLPRTASGCSDYWGKIQAQEHADRAQRGQDYSPDTSFSRPMTYIDPGQADDVKTKVLEVKNSQLEDRVAELERQLAMMAAQQ